MDVEAKGERAGRILEMEVYKDAVEGAKARIKNEWAAAEDAVRRDQLWHQLQSIESVTRELRAIRDRGVKSKHDREKQK